MKKTDNKTVKQLIHEQKMKNRLNFATKTSFDDLCKQFDTTTQGLDNAGVEAAKEIYGTNIITHGNKNPLFKRIFKAFVNPFTIILLALATVSTFTDTIFVDPGEENYITVAIITTMVMISGLLRFVQETRSGRAAEQLLKMIKTTATVLRRPNGASEIPLEDIVVGDLVHLSAGDMIPADLRIIRAKDLFISQSALTGESEPVEKLPAACLKTYDSLTDLPNLAFMGSNVISGTAEAIVIATGDDTLLGSMAQTLNKEHVATSFEKGVNSVSWVLIRFMLVMVPVVLFINGFTKGDWLEALLFAISVAVGLTPEMLPMIVTTCLAKGAVSMAKEKTIIKNLNSIQNIGSIDILCTDKTGTLTQDKVVLEYHLNISGQEDVRVLRHAFLNSYFQKGLKNLMDIVVIERTQEEALEHESLQGLANNYTKIDEIPFDFERRRMSVVVQDQTGKTQIITKGAVEEMLNICSWAEHNGEIKPLDSEIRKFILEQVNKLNENGMRVIAVAQKKGTATEGEFSVADESEMVFIGYLAFLDPPKDSTAKAVSALHEYSVNVKVLTGDNEKVTKYICKKVGIPVDNILLGSDIDKMSDTELFNVSDAIHVFAKLSPLQKARIVSVLRQNGHVVGYMGDGINDAAAMQASDVGISVDKAVDIAKEAADVVLLEKDLLVLEKGIIEGRKTYANMIKYIKMTASSNFGNMFSVLVASAFLPFLPMMSLHLILLNLIYDLSCTALPWDNVDKEYLRTPKKWDATSIGRFMIWLGPTSSVFDITTYLLMYFVICPQMNGGLMFHEITDPTQQAYFIALFQSGWFIESMWSQTLVIHTLRTPKIPFIQSRASFPVITLTGLGILALTIIPFTSFGAAIHLTALPNEYFGWLALTIFLYILLATLFKNIYIKKYGELL